ncbi:MAG: hypothetical protein DIU84_09945 [Bacillota bacterium]|nr:MAG: hypothetical protein DIU84_09945 [Bacillota bacterium]
MLARLKSRVYLWTAGLMSLVARRAVGTARSQRGATTAEYALVYSDNVRHVRRLDDLGRVVLPIESRHRLGLKRGDAVEVVDVPEGILLRPIRAGRARP